ncbi:hypothetical protein OAF21_00870 [Akkermansiaceae bacterium]|nr:hypothetical protein [Akkermansiaceae bacterium]
MRNSSRFQLPSFLFLGTLISGAVISASAAEKITFEDHVFPILESNCLNCHNPDKKKGGLDLSTYQGALAGGSGGKIAVAGDGPSSKLYTVTIHTEEPVMPPEGDKLDKKTTDVLRAWVDGGLLETKSSKARKAKKPAFSLTATTNPQSKPEGPLPMPKDILLEPAVVPSRSTVINDMEASPWAPLLAVTGQRQILLYNTDSLELVGILPFPYGTPETLSFHSSGKYLLAGGGIGGKSGTTVTWDITTGKVLMTMGKEFDSVLAADLRADLGAIALGGPSRLIKLWDTQAAEQTLKIKKHTDWVTSLSYSPDGVLLATGDRNNGIQIWEAQTGNEFHPLRGHQKGIVDLKWRADSNLIASASQDGDLAFWDMNQGKQIKKQRAHNEGVLAMDYARDGQMISSGRDKRVKIWKPDLGLKKELPPFKAQVTEVEFSHDSKRFFTADWNGVIQVWENDSFKEIGTLEANPPMIATRLIELNTNTAILAKATADARADVPKKEKGHTDAKNGLAWIQKTIPELKTKIGVLQKEIGKQGGLWNRFENEQKQLINRIQQTENEVKQQRDSLTAWEKERQKFIEDLKQARDQKNEGLIAQVDQRLKEKDNQIKGGRDNMNSREIAIKKLREEHKASITKRDEAGKIKGDQEAQLRTAKVELPKREKGLEPAKKGLTWAAGELKKAQDQVTATEQAQAHHQARIKHWQAAEINTALVSATSNFNSLKVTISNLQADLKLSAQEGKADEVARLKNDLDQAAARKVNDEAKLVDLRKRYKEAK